MKPHFLFANEWWLLAIPLVGLSGWGLWIFSRRLAEKRLRLFFSERFAREAALSIDRRIKRRRFLLLLGVLALLGLALARPLTGPKTETADRQGFDFIIALDVSKSMLTEDVAPNRLAAVKKEFSEFLEHEAGDRIGLVLFAGDAFVQAPLTFDYNALAFVLEQAGPRSISMGSTDVAKAIERAQAMLEKTPVESRTLVILTDGEDLKANAVEAARKAHATDHLTISTIGVGTLEGGEVPEIDYSKPGPEQTRQKRYVRDEYGVLAHSRKDERTLRAIANAGGGHYHEFKPGARTFQQWHDQNVLTLAKKGQKVDISDYFEWFQLPLLCAMLLLFVEPLLRPRAGKKRAAVGVAVVQPETLSRPLVPELQTKKTRATVTKVAALLLLAMPSLRAEPVQEAELLLTQGKKEAAIALMRKVAEANSGDLGLYYNYGLTLYRAGRFQESADVFQTIETTSPDKEMQAKAVMAMGNAQYRIGEDQRNKKTLSGAALAMERALGYYESINATNSSRASRNNREAAAEQLKEILLNLGKEKAAAADAQTQKDNLTAAEQALRDAKQAFEHVQQIDPKNEEAKKKEEEVRQKLVANLTKQAEQKALEADAMEQKKQPPAPADSTPPPPPATAQNPPAAPPPSPTPQPPPAAGQPTPPQTAANPPAPANATPPAAPPATAANPSPSPPAAGNQAAATPPKQGRKNGPPADPRQDVITKRQEAVSEYDQALEQNPDNKTVQTARQDQLHKISDLLTTSAEEAATPLLNKEKPTLKELNTLEQGAKTLTEAMADNPDNQKAQTLARNVSKKLEDTYTQAGEAALATAEMTPRNARQERAEAQRQLNQVSRASTNFQKALEQNADSKPAKAGLAKAQAKLPELYAALGKDDIAKAREALTPPPGAAQKSAPPQAAMQKAVGFMEKAAQDYDQAVGLAPENADFKSGLAEAQQMLSQYRDQLDKQMQANARQQGQDAEAPANAQAQAADPQGEAGEPGQTLSMTDLRGSHASPRTSDKFWDKKIRDW